MFHYPVHNKSNHKMQNSLRKKLADDGYAVLEDFLWPEECDELKEVGLEFTKKLPDPDKRIIFSSTDAEHRQALDKYFIESNDKIRPFFEESALDIDGNLKVPANVSLNKVGHALHLLHPVFRCYTYCDRVRRTCTELGFKQPAVVQSMLIYKNPGTGGAVIPHQDSTYLYTTPIPVVGFWIALEQATVENGCLWIARGSHKSGVHRRMIRNSDKESKNLMIYNKPAPIYPESSFTAVPVSKGSCIILNGDVVHKSAANRSTQPRPAYTFHVIEKSDNKYSPSNWLQEGKGAPFQNMYTTKQLLFEG